METNKTERTLKNDSNLTRNHKYRPYYSEIIKASASRELWSVTGHYFPDCSDSKRSL